jgi:hypothetical protein
LLFDVGGIVGIAGLAITFLVSAIVNGRALYAAEPIARPGSTAGLEGSTPTPRPV